jgi:hypothetical protein
MGKFVYEGLAMADVGFEEDFLELDDEDENWLGICGMIEKAAGSEVPPMYDVRQGKAIPPVFRVRVEITAEPCSPEEAWSFYEQKRGNRGA